MFGMVAMAEKVNSDSNWLINIAVIIAIGINLTTFITGGASFIQFTIKHGPPNMRDFGNYFPLLVWTIVLGLQIAVTAALRMKPLISGILFFLAGVGGYLIVPRGYFVLHLYRAAHMICGGLAVAYWWRTRRIKQ